MTDLLVLTQVQEGSISKLLASQSARERANARKKFGIF